MLSITPAFTQALTVKTSLLPVASHLGGLKELVPAVISKFKTAALLAGVASIIAVPIECYLATDTLDCFEPNPDPVNFLFHKTVTTLCPGPVAVYKPGKYTYRYVEQNTVQYKNLRTNDVSLIDMYNFVDRGKVCTRSYFDFLFHIVKYVTGVNFNKLRIPFGYVTFEYVQEYLGQNKSQLHISHTKWSLFPSTAQKLKPFDCLRDKVVISRMEDDVFIALPGQDTCISVPNQIFDRMKLLNEHMNRSVAKSTTDIAGKNLFSYHEWIPYSGAIQSSPLVVFNDIPTCVKLVFISLSLSSSSLDESGMIKEDKGSAPESSLPKTEAHLTFDEIIKDIGKATDATPTCTTIKFPAMPPLVSIPPCAKLFSSDDSLSKTTKFAAALEEGAILPTEFTTLTKIEPPKKVEVLEVDLSSIILPPKTEIVAVKKSSTIVPADQACAQMFVLTQAFNNGNYKPVCFIVCDPLINIPWLIPDKSPEAIDFMINTRYNKYDQQWDLSFQQEACAFMIEFASIFFRFGKISALDLEEVRKVQCSRSQKAVIAKGELMPRHKPVKSRECFIKAESYPECKADRPIVTHAPAEKEIYSSQMMSIQYYTKQHSEHVHWYGFGFDLANTAKRIVDKCNTAQKAQETDFSAFDVTVNGLCRVLEKIFLIHAFHEEEYYRVSELHSAQFNCKLWFRFNDYSQSVDSAFGRHSGSPETSIFNSVINAFVAYVVLRKTLTPDQAWNKLGIYGGDDGVTFDADKDYYELVAKRLGLTLKIKEAKRENNDPITFLARTFDDCWGGSPCNRLDIKRGLGHFHVSACNSGLHKDELLYLKAEAYLCSDAHHPFIGPLMRKLVKIYGPKYQAKYKKLFDDLSAGKITPFDKLNENQRVVDVIGFWSKGNVKPCKACLDKWWKELEEETTNLDLVMKGIRNAKQINHIPQLLFAVEDKPFSKTWVKLNFKNGKYDTANPILGTLDEMPKYPQRKIQYPSKQMIDQLDRFAQKHFKEESTKHKPPTYRKEDGK